MLTNAASLWLYTLSLVRKDWAVLETAVQSGS